jgi:hypothetical protein
MPLDGACGEPRCSRPQQPAFGDRQQLGAGFRAFRRSGRGVAALGQGVELALLLMETRGGLGDLLEQLLLPDRFARDGTGQQIKIEPVPLLPQRILVSAVGDLKQIAPQNRCRSGEAGSMVAVWSFRMSDDKRAAEIKKWQDGLFDAFRHNGVLGDRYFGPVMDMEPQIGGVFVEKYYGHRVLTDSFMDFFGETLSKQREYNEQKGWPKDRPYYVTCLVMYLTMFRSLRAAEVAALNGYPLQATSFSAASRTRSSSCAVPQTT